MKSAAGEPTSNERTRKCQFTCQPHGGYHWGMPALLSAAQIAAKNAESEPELSDEELLKNFVSNIPSHPNPDSQIDSP